MPTIAALLASCQEIDLFTKRLHVITLPEECVRPVKQYVALLGKSDPVDNVSVRDAVVLTIAQALILSHAPTGFDPVVDPGRRAAEAVRHAEIADDISLMFLARPRAIKCEDHLRDIVTLLVLTSPKHTMRDVDRIYTQFCSSGTQARMNHQIEADACAFLARSLRSFARLLIAVPSQLAHIVELNADSKAIPSVLQRIIRSMDRTSSSCTLSAPA